MMNRGNLVLCALLLGQLTLVGMRMSGDEDSADGISRGLLIEALDTEVVTRISIESSSNDKETVTLERGSSKDEWLVVESSGYPADDSKVDSVLRELAGLEIADVVSTSINHHVNFKVADADFDKRLILKGGGKKVELLFGTSGRANSVHVRRVGEDTVYAVRNYSSWRLSARPDSWIKKAYFVIDEKRIVKATIRNEHGSFELARHADDGWTVRIEEGDYIVADKKKVQSFLGKINDLTMSKVAGRASDDALDLSGPVVELNIGMGEPPDQAAGTLDLGKDGGTSSALDGAGSESATLVAQNERSLRIARKDGEQDVYLMHTGASAFIVEVSKWSINALLDTEAGNFIEKTREDVALDNHVSH